MTITLREYIARRPAEIRQQLAALRAEMRELDAAERACLPRSSSERRRAMTIKEMSRGVLQGRRDGASTAVIRDLIKAQFGVAITRESLAPQLSRLKADGIVRYADGAWMLTNPATPQ